jgi:hypothetical protein
MKETVKETAVVEMAVKETAVMETVVKWWNDERVNPGERVLCSFFLVWKQSNFLSSV